MKKITLSVISPYSVEKMYYLVNDVKSYYKFVPNCIGSRILETTKQYNIASIDVLKYGIKNTFTTKNKLVDNKSINMNIINNKYLKLVGSWNFIKINNTSCIINFNIEFKLLSVFMNYIFNIFFEESTKNIVQAFNNRAEKIFCNSI